jgi:hypothetical protein
MGKILNADGDSVSSQTIDWPKVIYLYGIPGAICVFLVYLLALNVPNALASVQKDVTMLQRDHRDQAYTQRAMCLSLAKLAATDPNLCWPPDVK